MGLALGAAMDDYPHSVMMDNTGAKDGSFYSLALFGTTRFNDSGNASATTTCQTTSWQMQSKTNTVPTHSIFATRKSTKSRASYGRGTV